MLLLLVAFNKTTVARYDADRRGIQSIILAHCPVLPDHFKVIDKISILKIKASKLTDSNALKNVQHELGLLNRCCTRLCPDVAKGIEFEQQLIEINLKLWNIEDNLRSKEERQEFDEEFVALARQVYLTNDARARLKQLINTEFPSGLREEKSYLS